MCSHKTNPGLPPCTFFSPPGRVFCIRKDRDRDLEKFTKGECWLMFATDVTRQQFLRHTMGCCDVGCLLSLTILDGYLQQIRDQQQPFE